LVGGFKPAWWVASNHTSSLSYDICKTFYLLK
jgi:hypothetical protein